MSQIFNSPSSSAVQVAGQSSLFSVHRIYCVGRNYMEHALEMGGDPDREEPFFFTKPADAIWQGDDELPFPPRTNNLHHEVELVVAIGSEGRDVDVADALSLIYGYAVGVDMTRRDLQNEAKERRRPWDMAKGFDCSAPMSNIARVEEIGHPDSGVISLTVNGEDRQSGNLNQQVWNVPEIVANLSTYVTLKPGDLIMTGTPAGVGPLRPGDLVACEIEGIGELGFQMGQPA